MSGILLTAYDGAFLGPIAKFLGLIMDGIYYVFSLLGIENVTLSILLLTIIIYTLLLPLTYKQQKFSKLNQVMMPEMNAIREKYAGRRDQASMNAMNEETQLLYQKYGVSPMGSCIQMLIQMPILFALYRVFYNIPGYVNGVCGKFDNLVSSLTTNDGKEISENVLKNISGIMEQYDVTTSSGLTSSNVVENLKDINDAEILHDYLVDIFYKLPSKGWDALCDTFKNISDVVQNTADELSHVNNFLGLNISDSPINIIMNSWSEHAYLYVFIALMIPVLSYLTQYISARLIPQANGNDQMASQMKMMNRIMPLFSLFICFGVPVGLGLYWVFSAAYRCVQQAVLNKHFEKIGIDNLIAKNQEKAKKKLEKRGITENKIREAAQIKTRTLNGNLNAMINEEKEQQLEAANELKMNAKPGSLAAKANLVKEFNERNSRK